MQRCGARGHGTPDGSSEGSNDLQTATQHRPGSARSHSHTLKKMFSSVPSGALMGRAGLPDVLGTGADMRPGGTIPTSTG